MKHYRVYYLWEGERYWAGDHETKEGAKIEVDKFLRDNWTAWYEPIKFNSRGEPIIPIQDQV